MPRPDKFSVEWTESAVLDLEGVLDSIASESIASAEDVLTRLEQSASRLARLPLRGRVVPELREQGVHIYREIIPAPWRLIYRIEGRTVWVLAVIDGRRNLEDLLLQRFLH